MADLCKKINVELQACGLTSGAKRTNFEAFLILDLLQRLLEVFIIELAFLSLGDHDDFGTLVGPSRDVRFAFERAHDDNRSHFLTLPGQSTCHALLMLVSFRVRGVCLESLLLHLAQLAFVEIRGLALAVLLEVKRRWHRQA